MSWLPTYEEFQTTYTEIRKAQWVRTLDVYVLGPFSVAVSLWPGPIPILLRLALGAYGIATIYYNHRNKVATEAAVEESRRLAAQRAEVDRLTDELIASYQANYYQPTPYVYSW